MSVPSGLLLYGGNYSQIECLTGLTPYDPASLEVQAGESFVVGTFQPEPQSVSRPAVLTFALIRDTLRDNLNSIELLSEACCRPRWRVMLADLYDCVDWYPSLRDSNANDLCELRPLLSKGPDGQNCTTWLPRRISRRRAKHAMRSLVWPHPWQSHPPFQPI
jgi:hypothetical protein